MSTNSKIVVTMSTLSAALLVAAIGTLTAAPRAPFEGVWRTAEVVVQGAAPQVFKPGATLAIFHGRHYSRVEVHAEGPRPVVKDPAAASADELRASWGPFIGEAGTFELSGSNTITMRATVAKNPAAMTNGAASVYSYQRSGDNLTLTQLRTYAGPAAPPVVVKLTRVE